MEKEFQVQTTKTETIEATMTRKQIAYALLAVALSDLKMDHEDILGDVGTSLRNEGYVYFGDSAWESNYNLEAALLVDAVNLLLFGEVLKIDERKDGTVGFDQIALESVEYIKQ